MAPKGLVLPTLVIGTADVARLRRELEALNDYLYQAGLRAGGATTSQIPKTSRVMDEFIAVNKLNILQTEVRTAAAQYLELVAEQAPVVHMSFAVEPSSAFRQKMIIWWRSNVHASILMDVGLQPDIAIGTIVRTPNKQYDFSLREHFNKKRDVLVKFLDQGLAT